MPTNTTDYQGGRVNTNTPQGYASYGPPQQMYAPDNLFGDAIAAKLKRRNQVQAMTAPQAAPQQQQYAPQPQLGQSNQQADAFDAMQASRAAREYDETPASFGRFQMNQTGNWGTFVDPANIPVRLQDKIMGGFYGQGGNWDTSNPSISGPQQFKIGKYTHSGGGGGPVSGAPDAAASTGGYVPGVGYSGGGAQGSGADWARIQQAAALARSNQESTPSYQPGVMRGNYGG